MVIRSDIMGFPFAGMPVLTDVTDAFSLGNLYKQPLRANGLLIDVNGNTRFAGVCTVTSLTLSGAISGATTIGASSTVTLSSDTAPLTLSGDNAVLNMTGANAVLNMTGINASIGTNLSPVRRGFFGDLEIRKPPTVRGVPMPTLDSVYGVFLQKKLVTPMYDDIRVTPAGFDRAGIADPALVSYTPTGAGIATYLYEFQVNDIAYFTVQLPHSYMEGQDIRVHIHWTPGSRGSAESGNKVGWKVDYSWANIDGTFSAMTTADLSDACDGTNDKHQMTPSVTITGTSKSISSMLICNVKRTDTGTDDTWSSVNSGELPLLLEIDFHFPIDTLGSSDWGTK